MVDYSRMFSGNLEWGTISRFGLAEGFAFRGSQLDTEGELRTHAGPIEINLAYAS